MDPKTLSRAVAAVAAVALLAAAGSPAAPVFAGQDRAPANGGREVVTPSGVKYTDLRPGQGEEIALGKIVEVHYSGWLEDGTKFDSSKDRDRPFTFRVGAGDALKGWDEGLLGMRVGGRRRLVIPPELGFGKQGVGGVVPPNSVLFYEFELLGVR
jgi:peptidylprolyl isomerase